MAEAESAVPRQPPTPKIAPVLLIGLLCLVVGGCASGRTDRPEEPDGAAIPGMPPQTISRVSPSPPDPSTEEPVAIEPKDPHTIVIEEGGEEGQKKNLAEVARKERARRQDASVPIAVITDKNLEQYATGKLTYTGPRSDDASEETTESDSDIPSEDEEAYWRDRVRDQRRRWAESVDRIHDLEQAVSELRTRFYAEDDPYVRDARIKPQWDRALDQLGEARRRAERLERELDEILTEGRRAGALPGWLREGSELEPESRPYGDSLQEEEPAVVGEPVIVEEG